MDRAVGIRREIARAMPLLGIILHRRRSFHPGSAAIARRGRRERAISPLPLAFACPDRDERFALARDLRAIAEARPKRRGSFRGHETFARA